jgi:hypothetical protein
MTDSHSINVESSPKLELYAKQTKNIISEAEHSPSSIQKVIQLTNLKIKIIMYHMFVIIITIISNSRKQLNLVNYKCA